MFIIHCMVFFSAVSEVKKNAFLSLHARLGEPILCKTNKFTCLLYGRSEGRSKSMLFQLRINTL